MSRFIDPVPQYLDENGNPLVNAKLYFFKSGTNTPLDTFADKDQTIPNTNPVELSADAIAPNVFYSGSAKVILTYDIPELAQVGVQRWERDPVGGDSELGNFELFDVSVIYDKNDIVEGSDSKFYISLVDDNQGNEPSANPASWSEIRFIGVWNTNVNYSTGDVVQTADGDLWRSLIGNNVSNDPAADDGTKWLPALDGSKIPEVIELEARNLWNGESSAFNVAANRKYQIDASGGSVDATLAASYNVGDEIIVHNESISTNTVRLVNTALTIKGPSGTITTADNLVLSAGDTVHLAFKTTTIAEVV